MTASNRAPFRLHPPDLPDRMVYRDRLLEQLRQRFDHRLTVLRAGAGFGKTTLLAHAVTENRLDPVGTDVWLQLLETDRQPEQLLLGLLAALGSNEQPANLDLSDIVDRIWASAPEHVALILDDLHVIDGSPAMSVVAGLCAQLPANGHLVLGTRTSPALPLRLLQARGQALLLDETDLAFSGFEQREFARVRHVALEPGSEMPSWPALAVLMSTVGHSASIEFLWEAVLQSIAPDRRRALALLVRFGRVDSEIVAAVLGTTWSTEALLDGLPLIETGDGDYRFHDLWRAALADTIDVEEWQRALATGAEVLIARGELARGARCLQAAGDDDRLVQLARAFGIAPITAGLSGSVAEVLIDCLPLQARNGALGRYLRTIETSSFQSDRVLHDLHEVFTLAVDTDPELASLALWRETQMLGDIAPASLSSDAVAELVAAVERFAADGWPMARCALGLITSHAAEQQRDVRGAIAAVSLFDGADPAVARASVTSRYLALGHPEQVAVTLDEVLGQGVSDPVSAQAVWFRGEIDPTLAWPIVRDLPAVYGNRRLPSVQVPLLGVLTSVALAAGDLAGARSLANDALDQSRRLLPRPASFALVADALVALAVEGDHAAVARLNALFADVPLDPWPPWSCLGALCAIRALVPGTEWLDDLDIGVSCRTAVQAGRALVELRAAGSVDAALALPWASVDLLRVHVPPSMLCELALAAGDASPEAAACFAGVPHSTRWVERLVDHPFAPLRATARALTSGIPVRPTYGLEVTTFGEFAIRRSDGQVVSERVRGGRVQQLVARLLTETSPLRTAIAERLWPDLSEKQAGANLRVTLASLLDSIEPDRRSGTSWFIRTEDGRLRLGEDGLVVDLREFERHLAAARDAERAGRLTDALVHHRAAFGCYQGEFMRGVADPDVEHARLRLQTLAYSSGCRLAELLLAKGEPEDALGVAVLAARIDPLAERARRTEIRSHLALGSTLAARTAARSLRSLLQAEGLRPDRDTELLLDRVDPADPGKPR